MLVLDWLDLAKQGIYGYQIIFMYTFMSQMFVHGYYESMYYSLRLNMALYIFGQWIRFNMSKL